MLNATLQYPKNVATECIGGPPTLAGDSARAPMQITARIDDYKVNGLEMRGNNLSVYSPKWQLLVPQRWRLFLPFPPVAEGYLEKSRLVDDLYKVFWIHTIVDFLRVFLHCCKYQEAIHNMFAVSTRHVCHASRITSHSVTCSGNVTNRTDFLLIFLLILPEFRFDSVHMPFFRASMQIKLSQGQSGLCTVMKETEVNNKLALQDSELIYCYK